MRHYATWETQLPYTKSHASRQNEMPHTSVRNSKESVFNLDERSTLSVAPERVLKKGKEECPKLRRVDHIKISDISELMIKYEIGNEIGKGAFGVVLQVTDKFTEMDWAMKIIEKHKVSL